MANLPGKLSVTDAAAPFGPTGVDGTKVKSFIIQNRGSDTVFFQYHGETAVADEGFNLIANESVSSKELPDAWRQGRWSAVCASGETATVYYHFS